MWQRIDHISCLADVGVHVVLGDSHFDVIQNMTIHGSGLKRRTSAKPKVQPLLACFFFSSCGCPATVAAKTVPVVLDSQGFNMRLAVEAEAGVVLAAGAAAHHQSQPGEQTRKGSPATRSWHSPILGLSSRRALTGGPRCFTQQSST